MPFELSDEFIFAYRVRDERTQTIATGLEDVLRVEINQNKLIWGEINSVTGKYDEK